MNNQLYILLQKLIQKNDISIHKEELKLQLLSHPSYPSLHSVTGVLEHLGIPNVAVKLEVIKEVLEQLPTYFLAMITNNDIEDLVLVQNKNQAIRIFSGDKNKKTMMSDTFLSQWNGIIIAIEKDETTEVSKPNPLPKIATWCFVSISIVGLYVFSSFATSLFSIVHFYSSCIGLALSILIIRQEFGFISAATQSICNFSEKTSCDEILNSKGANLFGILKLSDVSLITFAGFIITWLLYSLTSVESYTLLFTIVLVSIPAICYSIYYQAIVLKKWCPLCLGIVGVLTIQVGALFLTESWTTSFAITPQAVGLFAISFLFVLGIWTWLKSMLQKNIALEKIEVSHFKFKRNYSIFQTLWLGGQELKNSTPIPGELTFGIVHAPIELILVTSPFCYYCKSAHADIHKILLSGNDKVKVTLRFRVDAEDKQLDLYKVVSEILHVYHTNGQAACLQLLHHLYAEDTNVKDWLSKTNIHYNPGYNSIMQQQKTWCSSNEINFTPAFYINGYALPTAYDRTDLLFFLEDIIESTKNENPSLTLTRNKAS